ncbi:MAG TPA: squalene--hopene cyclase [Sporichthyaceae bacterium]|jgi:squalene-hopene/tetraprenyl-beta-curcumene cyclase|nr:squalene--hopene cyclase [Sporichthyaceae bacterium]
MTADTTEAQARRDSPAATADAAIAAAVECLRGLQDPAGWWKGELETNVTMDAEDLLLREFLGIRTAAETDAAARWIRRNQRPDGSWATFAGGPGDVSTTAEAWVALRLAGDEVTAPHMIAAAESVLAGGGVEASRVFTRIWFALFGLWRWEDLPNLPPEVILLPRWAPLNVYDFACWARQTIVPLTVVGTLRPVRPLAFGIDELRTGRSPVRPVQDWVGRAFGMLDKALHHYGRLPRNPVRRRSLRLCAEWIMARQEADGSWGGIQPPWVYSILALHLLGYPLEHPAVRAGLAGLDRFVIVEDSPVGPVRRLEACQSPVWDTALAVVALREAEVPADDSMLLRAADWLVGEEITVPGDWAVRRPDLAPGGWAFEFDNDLYPDTDDTAEVVMALHHAPGSDPAASAAAVERGIAWNIGMACADGGWGAFDADNTRTLPTRLPFCDFGNVTDPPSADVTAHAVEMLAVTGRAGDPACRRGVAWLRAAQEADGSWFGRWGANHVYGTGAVVPALIAAGVDPSDPAVRRAAAWLTAHQNADGGWGEDLRSYREPEWIGRGESTPSQTAWALLALLAADPKDPAVDRGISWLTDRQRPDGNWDEPFFTGTGFPGDFYLNYHLYRLTFPLLALARYVRARA